MGPSLNKKCKLVSLCPINCNHIHKLATTDFRFPREIVIYDIGFRQKRYLMMQEQFEYVLQKSKQHDDIPFNPKYPKNGRCKVYYSKTHPTTNLIFYN